MFNKIVFFHDHVNGDCFLSRILVKEVINETKLNNTYYYYTAPRAYISHCLDLGIPDENFNVVGVPDSNKIFYIMNNILFINVWIGIHTNTELDLNPTCALCLNNLFPKYNILINKLNKNFNMNIQLLDESSNKSPYLPFDNKVYDNKFIIDFIEQNKQKYQKIILICNNTPSTFISVVDITRRYLLVITEHFPNYLFVTFQKTLLQRKNLISIHEIYEETNTKITNNWGIMFPLLSKLADKVILLPTGPSLSCFNNETTKNKFMMLFDYSASGNPYGCLHCNNNNRNYLCTNRFNWEIKIMDVNYKDEDINNKICYFIKDFLQK